MGAHEVKVIIVAAIACLVLVGSLLPDRRAGYFIPVFKTISGIVGIGIGIGFAALGGYLVSVSGVDPFRWAMVGVGGLLAVVCCHGLEPVEPTYGSVSA